MQDVNPPRIPEMVADGVPYRSGLPGRPKEIRTLPLHRGFPVPFFVQWIDGVPEFRLMDQQKLVLCIRESRCWVCGGKLNNRATFVVGPMCSVTRTSAEPPSHPPCASYAAAACPFLSRPEMVRRENDLPEGTRDAPGLAIRRNPGVTCLWTTRTPGFQLIPQESGVLFRMWPPTNVEWYSRGRIATRDEVLESVDSGLPALLENCDNPDDEDMLHRMLHAASQFYPK